MLCDWLLSITGVSCQASGCETFVFDDLLSRTRVALDSGVLPVGVMSLM
jgi:hypothetical protein